MSIVMTVTALVNDIFNSKILMNIKENSEIVMAIITPPG